MRAIIIFMIALIMAGCATSNPFAGLSRAPQEPHRIANWLQEEEVIPLKIGVTADGKEVIAYATKRTYSAGSSETPEKLSWLQRLGRWIGGLSLLTVIFIVVSLVFFGGVPIVWAYKKYMAVKKALVNTVAAIEEMPPDAYEKLEPKLESKQNEPDKELIKKIKLNEL